MPMWRTMTARRAAPLLPENNDGSWYLYISQSDPTPESAQLDAPCAPRDARPLHDWKARDIFVASLHSLQRVKRLTHNAPELQARLCAGESPHDAPLQALSSTQRHFLQIGNRTQRCAAHLLRILCQRTA